MIRLLALVALLSTLPAGQALADPTTVTLEGFVTESTDADHAPGDSLQLTLDYSTNFAAWLNGAGGVPSDGLVQAALLVDGPVVDLAGIWTDALFRCIDVRTGNTSPGACDPDDPFHAIVGDVALEAGAAPEVLRFSGVLGWHPSTFPLSGIDGEEFLESFQGGEVELIRDGATVLRGLIVPEPSTALLLGAGLLALGRPRRRT